MRKIAFFVLVSTVFMASCTSVPLGTMWKLKDYSIENIKDIDPVEFRARVTHQSVFYVKPEGSVFTLDIYTSEEERHFEMPLEIIGTEDITRGVFRRKEFTKTMLKMSKAGIEDFVRLQKDSGKIEEYIRSRDKGDESENKRKRMHLSIRCPIDIADTDRTPKYLELSIELKLNGDEEFFTLIDSAKVEMKKEQMKK